MELTNVCTDNIEFEYINTSLLKLKNQYNIKLSNIKIPFGIEDYNKNYYLTLEINNESSLLLKEIENTIIEKYKNYMKELNNNVQLNFDIETVENNSFIKKENENTSLIKFKIKKYKTRPILNISNNISCFEIPKNINLSSIIINIQGVWMFNNKCGLLTYVTKINI